MAYTDHQSSTGRLYLPGPRDVLPTLLTWFTQQSKRKEVQALLDQEEWLLKDIGVSRDDVHEALSHRGNESNHLRAVAASNRRNQRRRTGL